MATEIWGDEACDRWHRALAAYDDVIEAQGVAHLPDHDRWVRHDLPGNLAARRGPDPVADPGYLTGDELARVTRWKMNRGVWRARNLALVKSNSEEAVRAASRAAFRAIPDPKRPIAALSGLAGVGPATASAVLAAVAPEMYPFFDDLVAIQIPDLGEVTFTAGYYHRYADRLRQRAADLSVACPHGGLTAHDLGQALWAAGGGKAGRPPAL